MKLSLVKATIIEKLKVSGEITPPEDEALGLFCNEALLYVCSEVDPAVLIVNADGLVEEDIYRYLQNEKALITPEFPDFKEGKRELQIDESLVYGVINKTCALICQKHEDVIRFEEETRKHLNRFRANSLSMAQWTR